MSEEKINMILELLPSAVDNISITDEKFLFFFDPVKMDEQKFLFGFSLKTGVQIFSVITIIQAINSFLDIFSPYSFRLFLISIIAFILQFLISFYAFLSTLKNKYLYAKTSYLIISFLFLIQAIYYISRSILKVIDFITPWDNDFLRLDFLIYIFGYGIFLFFYLYFIYILYIYMIHIKSSAFPQDNENQNNEEINLLNSNFENNS